MICSHHLSSGAMTGGPPVDAGKSGRRRTLLQIRSVGLISGLAGFVRPFGRRLGRLPEIDPSRCNRMHILALTMRAARIGLRMGRRT
jgi:hypothetical protein